MLNLSTILEDSSHNLPEKIAFVFNDTRLSFKQINTMANQVANALHRAGILPGDRIALSCPNLPYFPIIYFGILKTGAVVVPLSILLKKNEVAYHLQDSGAKLYFCFEGNAALPMGAEGYQGFGQVESCQQFICITSSPGGSTPFVETTTLSEFISLEKPDYESRPTGSEDTAVIIYTSGTTGRPKGAELSHSNLLWNADLCRHLFQLKPDDRMLIVLPLFHIFGQTCLMNAGIMHGLTSTMLVRFEAGAVQQLIVNEGITVFAGVPTMYWGLINYFDPDEDERLNRIRSTLRLCVSGGAALPSQIITDFEKKYNVPIYEGYGMSEGSPVVTFNHPGRVRKAGSIGNPVWGVQVKLVDENGDEVPLGEKGQLLYKGHNVMKGYYQNPEATAESLQDGWLYSGDVAIKDSDGYYYIVDRTKDMIIRGGLNVYPREVEEVMMNHSSVSMVAIIGVPDDQMGEEVMAYVVLKQGANLTEGELLTWTKDRVAAYKYPRKIQFIDSLPMNATGKILKRALRNL
ncbi:MAG: long-chain fatty acid--CoA ligase [Saprospiraceae bacterium]|nr:long-chain fatty acid--CoA ligase [Saprospiraceae bacterium]